MVKIGMLIKGTIDGAIGTITDIQQEKCGTERDGIRLGRKFAIVKWDKSTIRKDQTKQSITPVDWLELLIRHGDFECLSE